MDWLNEPPEWTETDGRLTVRTGAKTDFWRKTHYGFIRDNGHFYAEMVSGDFNAEVKVVGQYRDLYDQAGLMVRVDETIWMKCGIEYVDGQHLVSAVVTRDFSDWAVVPVSAGLEALWLRVERRGDAIEVRYSVDGQTYGLLRLAHLPGEQAQVGPMCASPEGEGFTAVFEGFQVTGV